MIQQDRIKRLRYQATIEKLVEQYESMGYDVKTEYPVREGFRADLYAEKDGERIVVEVIQDSRTSHAILAHIRKIVEAEGMKVLFRPLVSGIAKVEFGDFEELVNDFLTTGTLSEIDCLGHDVYADEISDVKFEDFILNSGSLQVSGTANCHITGYFDDERELNADEVLPCNFNMTLSFVDGKWQIDDVQQFLVNTDSFYN